MVHVFRNIGKRSWTEKYNPISLLYEKKLVNDRLFDQLKKCGLFSDFDYEFRSSRSTVSRMTVVSDRIARAFNGSKVALAIAFDISKADYHAGLLHKLKYF